MQNHKEVSNTYKYPRWYWSIGYLVCIFPLGVMIFAILSYVFEPDFSLKQLLIPLCFFGPLLFLAYRASNMYKKLYSDITVSKFGLNATVVESHNSLKKMRTGVLSNWKDIRKVETFEKYDLDAIRMGPGSSGVRLWVKSGRVLVLNRMPGFKDFMKDIDTYMKNSVGIKE